MSKKLTVKEVLLSGIGLRDLSVDELNELFQDVDNNTSHIFQALERAVVRRLEEDGFL